MKALENWFRLIRPLNVVLITLTPFALWVVLIYPQLAVPVLNPQQVIYMGMAIGMVAAGGNIVNDIADRTIDALNGRPNPLLNGLPVDFAWVSYVSVNVVAGVLTWQLAAELGLWKYVVLLPLAIGLLFAYAFSLKCLPWIGNLVIALFCAGVPGILVLAEPLVLDYAATSPLSQSLLGYMVFAFFGTWARELAKDMEDKLGDEAAGCRPLAVIWPEERVVRLIWVCMFFLLSAVAYVASIWALSQVYMNAITWGVLWMLLASITLSLSLKQDKAAYTAFSRNLKISMAFGLVLLLLVGAKLWS